MKHAFLTGYTGRPTRTPAQLLQLAINLEAVVVDSRFNPVSRWATHWNRIRLQDALGDRYLWLQPFGNSAYKENKINLVNPALGLTYITDIGVTRAIILCACSDGQTCHRKQVGEYLAANGWEVREVTKEEWEAAKC
jgi:hypothetical protein